MQCRQVKYRYRTISSPAIPPAPIRMASVAHHGDIRYGICHFLWFVKHHANLVLFCPKPGPLGIAALSRSYERKEQVRCQNPKKKKSAPRRFRLCRRKVGEEMLQLFAVKGLTAGQGKPRFVRRDPATIRKGKEVSGALSTGLCSGTRQGPSFSGQFRRWWAFSEPVHAARRAPVPAFPSCFRARARVSTTRVWSARLS